MVITILGGAAIGNSVLNSESIVLSPALYQLNNILEAVGIKL